MLKLMKYLKQSAWMIIAAIVMLFIQAYCDLTLPEYTAKIVDVGIQKGGIEEKVPNVIRKSEFDRVLLFVTDDKKDLVKSSYTQNDDKYELDDSKDKEELEDAMGKAMMITYMFESVDKNDENSKTTKDNIWKMMMQGAQAGKGQASKEQANEKPASEGQTNEGQAPKGQAPISSKDDLNSEVIFSMFTNMPKESLGKTLDGMMKQFDNMPDVMVDSTVNMFIQEEYKACDLDVGDMQIDYILSSGAKMLALSFGIMLLSIVVGFLAAKVGAKLSKTLRKLVFEKVVKFSNSEFDKFSTASLITRSTNDIQQVQIVVTLLIRMIFYAPILAIGGVIKVMQTDSSMTWIIGVGIGGIILLVIFMFVAVMPKFKKLQKQLDKLNLVMREIITGLPVIRAFSKEKYEEERFDESNKDYTKTNLFVGRAMSVMMPAMTLIMNGLMVLIIWVSSHRIDDGSMQIGAMTAFITYTMQIVISFLMLTLLTVFLPRAIVAAGRIDEIITTDLSINDKDKTEDIPNGNGEICFDNVEFTYDGADEPALSNISFTAKSGQTTAIIGSTGCGKSTLVNLIPRFYDVSKGKITIDGCDIRDLSQHDLRSMIGYVPQKAVLFSGTIESNIKFANEAMSDEQMTSAADIAQATEFIDTKDDKYKSYIAQGGNNVSGGQKQRLSIARAIAKKPKVFIFDDSFSALDYKTDSLLRKELNTKLKESTVIIVAQRISTIMKADKIIVLDDGVVEGIGTHEELLDKCDVYKQIALSQLSQEELAKGGAN